MHMPAAFQDEDLSLSLRDLLRDSRGRVTVAFELLALVGGGGVPNGCGRDGERRVRNMHHECFGLAAVAWVCNMADHGLGFGFRLPAPAGRSLLLPPHGHGAPPHRPRPHPCCAQVGMAPFLLLEVGTIPAYGIAGWLDIWNGLDVLTYFLQVRLGGQGTSCWGMVGRRGGGVGAVPPCRVGLHQLPAAACLVRL